MRFAALDAGSIPKNIPMKTTEPKASIIEFVLITAAMYLFTSATTV